MDITLQGGSKLYCRPVLSTPKDGIGEGREIYPPSYWRFRPLLVSL